MTDNMRQISMGGSKIQLPLPVTKAVLDLIPLLVDPFKKIQGKSHYVISSKTRHLQSFSRKSFPLHSDVLISVSSK